MLKKLSLGALALSLMIFMVGCGPSTPANDPSDSSRMEDDAMMQDDSMMEDDTMMEDDSMMMDDAMEDDSMMEDDAMEEESMEDDDAMMEAGVKEFTVEGSNFSFTPSSLTVNEGDTVRITFKNTGGMHDFVIDEFSTRTEVIQGGEEETIEFVADKAGSYEFYCSVGSHRAMGMMGTLVVQ